MGVCAAGRLGLGGLAAGVSAGFVEESVFESPFFRALWSWPLA